MKINLQKITKTPLDFELKSDEITFKGYLEYHTGKLVLLKAQIYGFLIKECDICAQEFKLNVDEKVEFFICDGIYENAHDIELDIVEFLDGVVDMDELFYSEIELIKSDYHSCEKCKQN